MIQVNIQEAESRLLAPGKALPGDKNIVVTRAGERDLRQKHIEGFRADRMPGRLEARVPDVAGLRRIRRGAGRHDRELAAVAGQRPAAGMKPPS